MAQSETPNDTFTLNISGFGIKVERKIDGQTLAAIMTIIMGTDKPVAAAPDTKGTSGASSDGAAVQMSLREFLDGAHASRKPDQIVAIGHYITQIEGQANFSRDDVKARFAVAREPMPANFPRDFALAEKAGMIAEVHGKQGRHYVTKTGLAAIRRKFSKDKEK